MAQAAQANPARLNCFSPLQFDILRRARARHLWPKDGKQHCRRRDFEIPGDRRFPECLEKWSVPAVTITLLGNISGYLNTRIIIYLQLSIVVSPHESSFKRAAR